VINNILKKRQRRVLSGAVVIMGAYGLSSLFGLIRSRALAGAFFGGREAELDVFFAASVVPDSILQPIFIGALGAVMIPMLAKLLAKNSRQAERSEGIAWNYVGAFGRSLFGAMLVISLGLLIGTESLVKIIAPGMSPEQIKLLIPTTRILIGSQIIFLISAITTSILQSWQRFLLPALAPLMYNLGIIGGTLLLVPKLGVYGPVLGSLAGAIGHLGIQLPIVIKEARGRLKGWWRAKDEIRVKKSWLLMLPRSLALAVARIEKPWVLFLASGMMAGSFAIYNLSRQLWALPISLFGMAVAQAAFPAMSAYRDDKKKLGKIIYSSLGYIWYLCLPAGVLLLVLRVPLVRLAFVYAMKDNWLPFAASLLDLLVLGIVSWWLVKDWGIVGVAVGLSLGSIVSFLTLLILFGKKYIGFGEMRLKEWFKILIGGIIMGVMLWGPMRALDQLLDTSKVLDLILLTGGVSLLGVGVYICLCRLLKVSYQKEMFSVLKRLRHIKRILLQTEEAVSKEEASLY
jgi:putative peptidoglycan lipid II flippase